MNACIAIGWAMLGYLAPTILALLTTRSVSISNSFRLWTAVAFGLIAFGIVNK